MWRALGIYRRQRSGVMKVTSALARCTLWVRQLWDGDLRTHPTAQCCITSWMQKLEPIELLILLSHFCAEKQSGACVLSQR
jgi:hypothetical protein